MITYVNTVLVSNGANPSIINNPSVANLVSANAGDFVVQALDNAEDGTQAPTVNTDKIRIGVVLAETTPIVDASGNVQNAHNVKWSNEIKKADIKSYRKMEYAADTEDTITIDFSKVDGNVLATLGQGGMTMVLRLTFKDLPTRFRNWTESYDYMTNNGDSAADIAKAFAKTINKQSKRARVLATAQGSVLTLVAMKYDDDNSADSINVSAKVRFNATMYWQNPKDAGFASSNKYPLSHQGGFIVKVDGKTYPASAKLVRDRENLSVGYQGILNHGEGTWPIIKPATVADINGQYDALTLEFENMYRAADDIFRKTKQTVEIYVTAGNVDTVESALSNFLGSPATSLNDTTAGAAYVEPANA